MQKQITLILFLIIITFSFTIKTNALKNNNLVNIYFFHSNTCSHCKEEMNFLSTLEKKYSNIKIYKYEIHKKDNQKIINEVEKIYKIKLNSVPLTIIGTNINTGFSEKSKLKFIKTIEYYSRYGYEDKIGMYLNLELPTYNTNKNNIDINSFINTYHNYQLFGIKTDDLDTSSISLLLGILLSVNLITIISNIIVTIITFKINDKKIKLLSYINYIEITFLMILNTLIDNFILSLIIYILIAVNIIFNLIKILTKQKHYIYVELIIIVSILNNLILTYFKSANLTILKNIKNINNIIGINSLYYYSNYVIIYIFITILILLIVYSLIEKILNIKKIIFNS